MGNDDEDDKDDDNNILNDNEGFRGMISILANYTVTDLLNDYYHIKRFHVESTKISKKNDNDDDMMSDVTKTGVLDPDICNYFKQNITKCNVMKCICFKRNINECNKNEIDDYNQNRRSQYLLNPETTLSSTRETVEIVTQQILDMIHCYVFHLSYCIRNIVGGEKKNKFVTLTKPEKQEKDIDDDDDKKDDGDDDKNDDDK